MNVIKIRDLSVVQFNDFCKANGLSIQIVRQEPNQLTKNELNLDFEIKIKTVEEQTKMEDNNEQ